MWPIGALILSNTGLLILSLFLLRGLKKERKKAINKDLTIQEQKLNALDQVIVGLAHAIRNPLAIILQGVGYLEGRISSEKDSVNVLNIIKNNIGRISNAINILVDFSVTTELAANPPDVKTMVEDVLASIKNSAKLENIEIKKEIQEDLPRVLADEKKMSEALSNIFLNAVQAMPEGGKLIIRSYLIRMNRLGNRIGRRADDYYRLGEQAIVLEIEDTGIGIPMKHLSRVFEPFFTNKEPREGMGLGLWITKNIIESQRGLVQIESKEKSGTKVTVKLRIAERGTWKRRES